MDKTNMTFYLIIFILYLRILFLVRLTIYLKNGINNLAYTSA